MRRTGPPKRKKALRSKPETTRDFIDRGRSSLGRDGERSRLARSALNRPTPLPGNTGTGKDPMSPTAKSPGRKTPQRPKEGPLTPGAYRRAVCRAARKRCMVTGRVARNADDARFDAHHPLPKRELRARGLYAHVFDERNGMWVDKIAHANHENASPRFPRDTVPESAWEFAAEMDKLARRGDGPQWATELVKRFHPAAGSSGTDPRRDDG